MNMKNHMSLQAHFAKQPPNSKSINGCRLFIAMMLDYHIYLSAY